MLSSGSLWLSPESAPGSYWQTFDPLINLLFWNQNTCYPDGMQHCLPVATISSWVHVVVFCLIPDFLLFKEQCKIPRRLLVWPEPKVRQQTTKVHSNNQQPPRNFCIVPVRNILQDICLYLFFPELMPIFLDAIFGYSVGVLKLKWLKKFKNYLA